MAYIVTVVAIVLAGLFAIMVKFWAGFVYFVLSILLLLAVFWGVYLIFKYFTSYKKEAEEGFKIYRAEIINKNDLSVEAFEASLPQYKKEYNKSLRRERVAKWFSIAFCFAVALAFLVGIIYV